jgi:hypothetical protein
MACESVVLTSLRAEDDFPRPQSLRRFNGVQEGRCQNGTRPPGLGLDRLGLGQTTDAAKQHGDAVLELLHSLGAGEYEDVLAPAGTGDLPVQLLTAARSRPVIAISPSNHAGPSSETCSASIR